MDDRRDGAEALSPLDALKAWEQDFLDSRRTIICSPEWESRVKTMVACSPTPGLWQVHVSREVPEDTVVILDEQAMKAHLRQTLQRASREPLFPEPDVPFKYRYRHLGPGWGGNHA